MRGLQHIPALAVGLALAGAGVLRAATVPFYGGTQAAIDPTPFSLIILPDTQYYTSQQNGGTAAMMNSQMQWIVDKLHTRNIVWVDLVGDCTDHGDAYQVEWDRAVTARNLIENPLTTSLVEGVPYSVDVGNHDQSPAGDENGTTAYYNQYFGEAHFSGRAYYGGHYGSNNDNHYSLFSTNGLNFIVISIEYDTTPDASVIAWADNLLRVYPNRWGIVSSHHLINTGLQASWSTQGQAIYTALRDNPNLFLMVCGHIAGEGRRSDTYQGRTVHTVMADYQERTNGGNGWLRIMTVFPAEGVIRVKTYSPWLGQFEADADSSSQFTLPVSFSTPTAVDDRVPPAFGLELLSQNPFPDGGTFDVVLERTSRVRLTVYDVAGRVVEVLADETMAAGRHPVRWNGEAAHGRAASGVYFVRMEAAGRNVTKRVVLVR